MGFSYNYTINQHVVLLSGLQYTVKGANDLWNATNYSPKIKNIDVQFSFLELSVTFGYRILVSKYTGMMKIKQAYLYL